MPQIGVYSASLLGLHDHSSLSLGGPLGLIRRVAGAVVTTIFGTGRSTTAAVFTKVKEIRINKATSGQMDISFTLTPSAGFVHGQIYHNGVAIGIDQSTNNPAGQTFTETIVLDLNENDTIEIWAYRINVGATAFITDLTFQYSPALDSIGQKEFITPLPLVAANAIDTTEVL